jgi:hypothetical protein
MKAPDRSQERITKDDLRRLGEIAICDIESLFERHPKLRAYRDRLFAVALCQGAALHYLDGRNGVKDFDVWCFFRAMPGRTFPYRRRGQVDFGDPRFGQSPGFEHFVGRRVDVLGRSLPVSADDAPVDVLRGYLADGSTASAKALAEKAVVIIWPENLLGTVVWPI